MGAKPIPAAAVAAIRPEKVADEFTSVYYKVASKQPSQLAQLYGADSEVSHAAGSNLVGVAGIAAGARALPLASKPVATVMTLDAMSSSAGGVVFVVVGSLEGAPFTQTFVLSRADGDKVGHFYCRNDIFRFISPAGQAPPTASEPHLVASGAEAAEFASAGTAPENTSAKAVKMAPSAPAVDVAVVNGHAPVAGDESDGYDTEEDGDDDDESETDEEAGSGDTEGLAANGGVAKGNNASPSKAVTPPSNETTASAPAATVAAATSPVKEDPTKKPADVSNGKAAISRTGGKTNGGVSGATMPAAKSSAPAKPKTWASIVSTVSGSSVAAPCGSSAAVQAPTVNVSTNPGGNAPSKAGETGGNKSDAATAGQSYNTNAKVPYSGGHIGSHHHQNNHQNHQHKSNESPGGGGWSSVDNKRHSNSHHGQQGHDGGFQKVMPSGQYGHSGFKHHQGRVYGPSAVIQLNTLPSDRAKDWRTLQQEFLDEFNSYGFPVRNVEVKTHKGLAFIEYQDQAGVRAAVAEWADGPRDKGNFKGIPLSVSEKRQRRPHMSGEGGMPGRGGRGGMRGGRGGGRGRGRGIPYSSNGGTGAHTAAAPAPATNTF